jgi:glycosyltransferase involved in cell wall biosynthesis
MGFGDLFMHENKTKVAFIKFGGCASGGTEKFIQNIAVNLSKDKYDITYFYCDSAPYIGSDWVHPDTDPSRKAFLEKSGIKLVKFKVEAKDVRYPTHPWVGTDFFDIFNEKDFDVIQTARAGHPEFPFTHINSTSIVDAVTLPGMAENKANVEKVIHISKFQSETWIKAGGDPEKVVIVPIFSEIKQEDGDDFRKELGISETDFVFGFHQRNDPGISSPVPLQAFKQLCSSNPPEIHFVLMGGSHKHDEWAKHLEIKNFHHLPHSGDIKTVEKFLRTLNVFSHGRSDGETFGLSIAEAMCYSLPVVSHAALSMGHVETIGRGGIVAESVQDYATEMLNLFKDENYRKSKSAMAKSEYETRLSTPANIRKIESIYEEVVKKKKVDDLPDDEFWERVWDK